MLAPLRVLIVLLLAALPAGQPSSVVAQGSRQEQIVARLTKEPRHIVWLNDTLLLVTLQGLGFNREIALITLPTGEVRILERGGCASPSPDQSKVAFVLGPASRGDVWLLDLRTNDRRQLTTGLAASCLAWSPNGRRIAVNVTSQAGRGDDILILSADTGRVEHLIGGGDISLEYPAWTPNAQRLLFTASQFLVSLAPITLTLTVSRIEYFELSSRRRSVLLDLLAERVTPTGLAPGPDGRSLLFATTGPRAGSSQIRAFDGTGTPIVLAEGDSPAWHPDGRSIMYVRGYGCPPFPCEGHELFVLRLP